MLDRFTEFHRDPLINFGAIQQTNKRTFLDHIITFFGGGNDRFNTNFFYQNSASVCKLNIRVDRPVAILITRHMLYVAKSHEPMLSACPACRNYFENNMSSIGRGRIISTQLPWSAWHPRWASRDRWHHHHGCRQWCWTRWLSCCIRNVSDVVRPSAGETISVSHATHLTASKLNFTLVSRLLNQTI